MLWGLWLRDLASVTFLNSESKRTTFVQQKKRVLLALGVEIVPFRPLEDSGI